MRTRRLLIAAFSAVATAGLLGLWMPPVVAEASCVGPAIAVGEAADPGRPAGAVADLTRGQSITVEGSLFHAGCEDSLGYGPGCHAPRPADPQTPLTGVALTLEQGGRTWDLGTADAVDRDEQYAISWTVTIPAGVALGAATLNARSASLPVQIR